jgi:hypothetical protein
LHNVQNLQNIKMAAKFLLNESKVKKIYKRQ